MTSWGYWRYFAVLVLLGFLAQVHSRPPWLTRPQGLLKRIAGGKESQPNKWPWQGLLLQLNKNSTTSYRPRCGAVLINPEWVVTSAACIFNAKKSTLKVVLGEHKRDEDEGTEHEYEVTTIHIHRKAFTETYGYNIALLKLSRPASIGESVRVVDLPKQGEQVRPGKRCYMVGWGSTEFKGERSNVLREVRMPVVSYKACRRNEELYSKIDEHSMLCAGVGRNRSKKSGCDGDAGGSFACKRGRRWVLQGVISWGDQMCRGYYYSVMTKMSSFVEWIQEKMISPPLEKPTCCMDTHYYCEKWKAKGYCDMDYFKPMVKGYYCRKTCGDCDPSTPPPPPPPPDHHDQHRVTVQFK